MREYELPLKRKPVPKELSDTGKYEYVIEEDVSRFIARRIERRTLRALEHADTKVQKSVQSIFDMAREYLATPIGIKDAFNNHDERRAFRRALTGDLKQFVEAQRIRAGAALTIFAYIESLPYFVGTHAQLFNPLAEKAKHFQDINRVRYESAVYDAISFEEKAELAQQTSKELLSILRELSVLIRRHRIELRSVE